MNEIWQIFTALFGMAVFIFLLLQVVYLLIFSLAGKFYKEKKYPQKLPLKRFVLYIPSYKEDGVILDTAMNALALDYPKELVHVVIIADSLQPSTLIKLRAMPLQVVEVSFEKSTKAKALNVALDQTKEVFDYALVFDADNVAASDYLYRMNEAFSQGHAVVQGQRTAKNKNTPMAILDAISEAINNHIFRKGHRVMGLSSAIIGSAMGLEFKLYNTVMRELTAVGGFDKEMELYLLRNKILVDYCESAIVYDEKVQKAEVFEKQRKRWLSAQIKYLKKHFFNGFYELFKNGNLDYFDKVIQMAIVPRVMLIGLLPVALGISLIPGAAPQPFLWLLIMAMGYLSILIAVPGSYFNKDLLSALTLLPKGILSFVSVIFKLKGANETFIHTPHGTIEEETKKTKDSK
ncbi:MULTISPECIES: glycosyltransferase [Rhodonellum]|nr:MULTISPECIES: glycosyltransferase family 2 protein [Rhodonellum]SDZ32723.1 Glycosyltransferase, catalytic subunit of cellulose synthase and poly-beta-1,6-N-acetylglucosamine synthase [Rhodonellum ikkaensis]